MVRLAVLLLVTAAAGLVPARAAGQYPLPADPELAVQPDLRRVATAVREGFRTRVVCRGGCVTVKLRVFVSSLTARTYGIGDYKGDVHVGGAPVLRDAEGRREVKVTFRRFARPLERAKELTLAVEARAKDPDGRVRTVVKRVTLHR